MDLRRISLLATLSLAHAACAQPAADAGDGSGDSADDLVGRTLVVHPGTPERHLDLGTHTVRPTVKETGNVVDVFTDDIIVAWLGGRVLAIRLALADGVVSDRFGFQLSVRATGTGTWLPIRGPENDPSWQWGSVTAFQVAGIWHVAGMMTRYQDSFAGTQPTLEILEIPRQTFEIGEQAEFRVHVVPTWNFWDWDEDGYEATLHLVDVEAKPSSPANAW